MRYNVWGKVTEEGRYFEMQKKLRTYIIVAVLLFALSSVGITVYADYTGGLTGIARSNDISATITTDKQSYEEGDNILFSLILNNESKYDVSSAVITPDISDGLSVTKGMAKKKKIGNISSGKEKEMIGTIARKEKESVLPWAPDLMTVMIAGVILLFLLIIAMIVYYLFSRGIVGRRQRHGIFFLAVFLAGMTLSAVHTKAETSDITLSPVVVVPYGEEEVVIRMDITLQLQP